MTSSKKKPALVLASSSPRRIAFLKDMGWSFHTLVPDLSEVVYPGESARHLVKRLAEEKARAVAPESLIKWGPAWLVSADTVVVAPDGKTILGKPKNQKQAKWMLEQLSGATHTVYTGFAVVPNLPVLGQASIQVVKTRVTLRDLAPSLIQQYIRTGEPMDKAGAYGAQGLGAILIEKVQGSYTNVVGLPLKELGEALEARGLSLFGSGGRKL